MNKNLKYPIIFALPALIIYFVMFIAPSLGSFYYSLTDWNLGAASVSFIGLQNFKDMFEDSVLIIAFKNTLIFAVIVTVMQNIIGFGLALALNEKLFLKTTLRTIYFLPIVISPLLVGYIFGAIYHPEFGILNQFLHAIGLHGLAEDWLNDPQIALYSIIGTELWRVSGFAMIIYLAGLQMVPSDCIEQSKIDGANYWKRLRHVIFPLIAQSFTVNFILSLIGCLKVFDIVFALTKGGPGFTTEVFNTYILRAFGRGALGYSTAANLVLFFLITCIAMVLLYFLRKREVEM
ncbi:carbohydrate ABC transporter permease [Paenibacillus psychroresistens]|nr:sugar ABC transporter permease [Paenibacillus psychroresistens]